MLHTIQINFVDIAISFDKYLFSYLQFNKKSFKQQSTTCLLLHL